MYYVGLTSKTNRDINLWNDSEVRNKYSLVTTIPKGTVVTVLLKSDERYVPYRTYLIKTEFGLVGWARFDSKELTMWSKPNPIEGLYYMGD